MTLDYPLPTRGTMSNSNTDTESIFQALAHGKIDKIPGNAAFVEFPLKQHTVATKFSIAERIKFAGEASKKASAENIRAKRINLKHKQD